MPLDTRTPEQKERDAKAGIGYLQQFTPSPFEIPGHYECSDGYGVVFDRSGGSLAISCKRIGPEPQDERGRGRLLNRSR